MDLSAGVEVLKAVVENAHSWESLKVLVDQLRVLQDLPEYRALDVYSALKPGLEFFEDNAPAAFRLRMALAQLIHDPNSPGVHRITQILEFAHANPNEFNQLLNVLGQSIERGDLQEFLKVVRRSLPNAEH